MKIQMELRTDPNFRAEAINICQIILDLRSWTLLLIYYLDSRPRGRRDTISKN